MEDAENTMSCANCYWAGPINEDGFAECKYLPPDVWILSDDTRIQVRPLVSPDDWCGMHRDRP